MMHGPLHEISLIEVLQLLQRGRRSGVLHVIGVNPDAPRHVRLLDGVIVDVEPDAGDDATRAGLVARCLISEIEAADDPVLLDRAVARAMREQLAGQSLGAMLHWQHGRFDFEAAPALPGPLSVLPDTLIFSMVASETRRVELAATTAEFHAVPDYASLDLLAAGDAPALTPRDWRVLDLVDGTRDIAAIAASLDEALEEVAGCVQALQAAAILELRVPPASSAAVARAAIEAGQYEAAAQVLRHRVDQHPEDVDAWRSLGLAEVGAGRFEEAIAAWQKWRVTDPEHAGDAAALMQAARTMVEALRDSRE